MSPTPRTNDISEDVGFDDEPIGLGLPGERFDLKCPECGAMLRLKTSRNGVFYGCETWGTTGCKGSHGAHSDGSPLGVPADQATKRARIQAHRAFDQLWKPDGGRKPLMTRAEAYEWMRLAMKIARLQAHISMFTQDQCTKLVRLVKQKFPATKTLWDRLAEDDD